MPALVRLYIVNVAFGFVLAVVFVALLLSLNVANLRALLLGSEMGLVALIMLIVFNGIVFAGAQFGVAVMCLGDEDDHGGGGRRDAVDAVPQPVKVELRRRDRR